MSHLRGVELQPLSLDIFEPVLGEERVSRARQVAEHFRERLAGRVFWNVNTTAVGGGVAEMLQSLLRYARGAGIDTRWLVMGGDPEFFRVTKRLHHALHGSAGDGSPLDDEARRIYEAAAAAFVTEVAACVQPDDLVLLHDPQTAGLAPRMLERGAHVIWRCHVGHDDPGPEVDRAWGFLAPYLEGVPAFVFSRRAYVPDFCDHGRATIIQPSIDAFATKNRELDEATIRTALVHTGLVEGPPPEPAQHAFVRGDGTPGRIERRADIVRLGRAPRWDSSLVVQVSRWDPLKDMEGVMRGFALLCEGSVPPADAHLVLAGPNVSGVTDDPEGGAVLDSVVEAWRGFPHAVRQRVHLACLPTADVEENAVIVNALQRHAAVVVQKSLHEGFGLTVTEAMWKGRAVLASAVGGIQDQIDDGVNGVLLSDPRDLDAFAARLRGLLESPAETERLGKAAREHVREKFLGVRHLLEYASLFERLGI
ncbi:MAG: glycosyltransferase [Myxococcota bacterium]|nr:glycosyltransferase [Myxococcota bacterium]